jgi:pyrroline-5-carboxylate reductase
MPSREIFPTDRPRRHAQLTAARVNRRLCETSEFSISRKRVAKYVFRMSIGFIGCGKMASALVEGLVQARVFSPNEIFISDSIADAVSSLAEKTGAQPRANNLEVAQAAETLLLCVKPNDIPAALREIGNRPDKLVISIAAGVTLKALQQSAGDGTRLVRVMPNTPALIHKGAAAYALGNTATSDDAMLTEKIFAAVGRVSRVEEKLLDAVTGLSGSGPAYAYVMVEALADAGVLMGLPRALSLELAAQTLAGAAEMVLQTGAHPAQLKDMVASPGGTTIAGIEALENGGLRAALINAVRAATERSQELGRLQ